MPESIFHLVAPDDWPAAGLYSPPSLAAEGFVHCSFADQVAGSANRHYAQAAELLVVELDPDRLDAALRVEDSYGSGTAFPHVYGPIPVAAARSVRRMRRDGEWTFNRADAAPGHAAPDH